MIALARVYSGSARRGDRLHRVLTVVCDGALEREPWRRDAQGVHIYRRRGLRVRYYEIRPGMIPWLRALARGREHAAL